MMQDVPRAGEVPLRASLPNISYAGGATPPDVGSLPGAQSRLIMSDTDHFRLEASRARRLAAAASDQRTRIGLETYAAECDARANEIETGCSGAPGVSQASGSGEDSTHHGGCGADQSVKGRGDDLEPDLRAS